MQTYQTRGAQQGGGGGGVPDWLLEQHQQQQQRREPPQRDQAQAQPVVPQGRLSPDVRRNYYTSTRQQQREYLQQQQQQAGSNGLNHNHNLRTRLPQHRIPASEPIYLDIDPSIHQPMTIDQSGHRSPLPATVSTSTTSGGSNSKSPPGVQQGRPDMPHANLNNSTNGGVQNRTNNNSSSTPNYPYVSPYVSSVAREHRVPGGMFENRSPKPNLVYNTHYGEKNNSLYDTTPIVSPTKTYPSNNNHDNMIMFGDDYDLGSINTGMSQQELLQKRRDVKKRRDGKYSSSSSKKKKTKNPIINMPPRLLTARSWDTSPITKMVSTSNNNNHTRGNYNINNNAHHYYLESSVSEIGIKAPKKHSRWNILRPLTTAEEEQGSTDASTRESAERTGNPAFLDQEGGTRDPTPSDNHSIGSSSFPLLSSTARHEFINEQFPRDAPVRYSQPVAQFQVPPQQQQQQLPSSYYNHQQQQQTPRTAHMDIYQRQHGDDLQELEDHLRYLQVQHHHLEQEVQERRRLQQRAGTAASDPPEYRRRSVRFASQLAQDLEEQGPSDEEGNTKESPTSVAQFDAAPEQEGQDKSNTSLLAPRSLFSDSPATSSKPKSILRKKHEAVLDANGRYRTGAGAYPGRNVVAAAAATPRFCDTNGREVSPIRSPTRRNNNSMQQPAYPMDPPQSSEDAHSIPENPDDKDIAVLFDSEADIDIELIRREYDEGSVISEAFIEAVAAIVLQTAIRRFLAIREANRLRSESETSGKHDNLRRTFSPSPTQTEGSLSQRAVASQDKSELESQAFSRTTSMRTVASGDQTEEDFFYDLAAIQIQCVFRGWWVRDNMNVDTYCSTLIQKIFRGFRARMEYEYDLYRITLVQALWRRKVASRRTRGLFHLVIRLQALVRGFHARKTFNRLGGFPVAVEPYESRSVSQEPSEATRQPKSVISRSPAFEKARMQRRRQNQRGKKEKVAKPPCSPEEAGIQQVAAIIIQTYWRSCFLRLCYLQNIADVTLVQSCVRRWLATRQLDTVRRRTSVRTEPNQLKPPRPQQQPSLSRAGARGGKFEIFGSRNSSSVGPDESVGSSIKKTTNSIDESVPSVPFKMLPEDDPDQPPSLTPPRKGRDHTSKRSPSHFDNANRFGGVQKTTWSASEASGQFAVTSNSSYETDNVESASDVSSGRRTDGQSKWGGQASRFTANSASNLNSQGQQSHAQTHLDEAITRSKQTVPKSKGWNAEEEINHEATRSLLMAWKQKDKANTFTIKPRGGT